MKLAFLTCGKTNEITSCINVLSASFEKSNISVIVKDAVDIMPSDVSDAFMFYYAQQAIQTKRPFMFLSAGKSFNISNKAKSPVYAANELYIHQLQKFLENNEIDGVVCFQIYQVQAVSYLKTYCGMKTKLFMVLPNYNCPEWIEETDPDMVFVSHMDLKTRMEKRGTNSSIVSLSGIPVADKFHYSTNKTDARNTLEIPLDIPCYLVRYGGEGFGDDPILLIRKLIERSKGEDLRIIVMTGRNSTLADSIRTRFTADPRVSTVPFSEQISQYMDASDVLLTKPDVISLTEAAVKGIPFVCSAPVTDLEAQTVEFFAQRNLCGIPGTFEQIIDCTVELGQNEEARDERFLELRKNIPHKAAEKITGAVIGTLQSTSQIQD